MMRAVLIGDPEKIEGNIRKVFPGIKDASQKSMARIVIDLSSKIKFQKLSAQQYNAGLGLNNNEQAMQQAQNNLKNSTVGLQFNARRSYRRRVVSSWRTR